MADWRVWGAAPRPGRGRGASAPQRTENRKQKTERAASARQNNRCAEKPNFQASKLPNFQLPLHPRHVCDVPTSDAVGHIGPIGRRLPPLSRTVCLSPRRGAPASPESPASPEHVVPGRVRLRRTNSPKHGVRSPPCPYRPPGRTCALCARTARPLRCLSLCSLAVEGLALRACTVVLRVLRDSRAA